MATFQKQKKPDAKCNYFRFYMGRPEQTGDSRVIFKSAIYSAESRRPRGPADPA